MVVGPEFGPVAGLCVALVQRARELARRSALALAVGFPLAIAATMLATLAFDGADLIPDDVRQRRRTRSPASISSPTRSRSSSPSARARPAC